MDDDLTPATFGEALRSAFEVRIDGELAMTLLLHQVVEHAPSPGGPRAQPFSLMFLGPAGQHLPQATYTLSHAELGTLDIFLVPIGPAADGHHQYEAAFN